MLNRNIKVLNIISSIQDGGIEHVFVDYSNAIKNNLNYEILNIVSVNFPDYLKKQIITHSGNNSISELNYYNSLFHNGRAKSLLITDIIKRAAAKIKVILELRSKIRSFKPDIILCHCKMSLLRSKIARFGIKVPIVYVSHSHHYRKKLQGDFTFIVNSSIRELILNKKGQKDSHILLQPNMVNVKALEAKKKSSILSYSNSADKIIIGAIGRLVDDKNFDKVIKVIEKLRANNINAYGVIAGEGKEMENLKDLTKKLKLDKYIKFTGWLKDKKQFYEQIDLLFFPSKHETFGLAIIEAMAVNIPVVTTKNNGSKDICENNVNSIIIEYDEDKEEEFIEESSKEIIKLINDNNFSRDIIAAGYKTAQKYSIENVSKILQENILKVIN